MHTWTLKTALYCATIMIFGLSAFGQETKVVSWEEMTPSQRAEAEKALEQKLEAKPVGTTPTTQKVADDPSLTPRERAIKLRAREIELRKELKDIEKGKKNLDTPSERKARKEIEKEEKAQRNARQDELRKINSAELSGCDPGTVWVSRRAVQRSLGRVVVHVRATNTGTFPSDIESPLYGGVLVKNLCSGGSVTLSFVLQWTDSYQVNIPLTAIAITPDGVVATDTFSVQLSAGNASYNRVQAVPWSIRLQRQQQTR